MCYQCSASTPQKLLRDGHSPPGNPLMRAAREKASSCLRSEQLRHTCRLAIPPVIFYPNCVTELPHDPPTASASERCDMSPVDRGMLNALPLNKPHDVGRPKALIPRDLRSPVSPTLCQGECECLERAIPRLDLGIAIGDGRRLRILEYSDLLGTTQIRV